MRSSLTTAIHPLMDSARTEAIPVLVTVQEAARLRKLHVRTVRTWIDKRYLPVRGYRPGAGRHGRQRLIALADLDAFLLLDRPPGRPPIGR